MEYHNNILFFLLTGSVAVAHSKFSVGYEINKNVFSSLFPFVFCVYVSSFYGSSFSRIAVWLLLLLQRKTWCPFAVQNRLVPPEYPLVLNRWGHQLNGTILGPMEEGDDIVLTCRVTGGKPRNSIASHFCSCFFFSSFFLFNTYRTQLLLQLIQFSAQLFAVFRIFRSVVGVFLCWHHTLPFIRFIAESIHWVHSFRSLYAFVAEHFDSFSSVFLCVFIQ